MPGRKSSDEDSHSLSHSELAPPLTPARIQSGWYFDERGNRKPLDDQTMRSSVEPRKPSTRSGSVSDQSSTTMPARQRESRP